MSLRPGAWIALYLIYVSQDPGSMFDPACRRPMLPGPMRRPDRDHACRIWANSDTATRFNSKQLRNGNRGRGLGLGSEEAIFDPSCARAKQGRQASCPRGPRFACVALPADRFGRIPVPASLWVDLRSSCLKGSVMRITCRWNGPSCSLRIHPSSSRRQAASV